MSAFSITETHSLHMNVDNIFSERNFTIVFAIFFLAHSAGYLSLPSSPVLQSDILSNTVRFSCQTPQAIEPGSVYQFTWSSNGTELRTISLMGVLIDTLNSSSLQESGRKSILSSGVRSIWKVGWGVMALFQ